MKDSVRERHPLPSKLYLIRHMHNDTSISKRECIRIPVFVGQNPWVTHSKYVCSSSSSVVIWIAAWFVVQLVWSLGLCLGIQQIR